MVELPTNPEALTAEEVTYQPEALVPTGSRATTRPPSPRSTGKTTPTVSTPTSPFPRNASGRRPVPVRLHFRHSRTGLVPPVAATHLELTEQDIDLTTFIVCNLDGHGFLEATIEDICAYGHCTEEEAGGRLRLRKALTRRASPPATSANPCSSSWTGSIITTPCPTGSSSSTWGYSNRATTPN